MVLKAPPRMMDKKNKKTRKKTKRKDNLFEKGTAGRLLGAGVGLVGLAVGLSALGSVNN